LLKAQVGDHDVGPKLFYKSQRLLRR
jgi:hypothetical protein